jgi:hypothetical protein
MGFNRNGPIPSNADVSMMSEIEDENVEADETSSDQINNQEPIPRASFRVRDFGLGRVLSISAQNPFIYRSTDDRGLKQWLWMMSTLGEERWKWYQRHGLSCGRTNADFWDFLIQGVGAAPVIPFLVLITGFVLAIGPTNFFFLRRWNRLYLILFTVPIGALIVTSGLLGYAFLGDGLSTRMRVRSFTLLDDVSGDAISWSRQSYYAGLPPSDGIRFPATAAVYPIVYAPDEEHGSDTLLLWRNDQQILARGYLRTRALSQLLVCNSAPFHGQVAITRNGNEVTAKNETTSDFDFLVAVDPAKACCYVMESVPAGQDVQLAQASLDVVQDITNELLKKNRLTIPKRVDFGQRQIRYWNAMDSEENAVAAGTSILENSIDELRLRELPSEYVYFAITPTCPDFVPHGAKSSSAEEDGFHVIKGTWRP